MGGKLLIVLAVLFLALSAIAIVYVLGIRSGSSPVRNAARPFHDTVGDARPIAPQRVPKDMPSPRWRARLDLSGSA